MRRRYRRGRLYPMSSAPILGKQDKPVHIEVPKIDLVSPIQVRNFMRGAKFFISTLVNLQRYCLQSPNQKVAVGVRRKTKRITFSTLSASMLKTKSTALISIPMSKLEMMLLWEALLKAGEVKNILQVRNAELDDRYRLCQLRYWRGEDSRLFRENGKVRRLVERFGVFCESPRLMLCQQNMGSGGFNLIVVAPKERIPVAQEWIEKMRYEYSPFRGRISLMGHDGFGFSDDAKLVGWKDLVPNKEIHDEFEIIERSLLSPKDLEKEGLQVKRGLLLYGPPGTGKTLHLECLITTAVKNKIAIFIVRGLSQRGSLSHVYETAQAAGPSLVILEDVDTIAVDRESVAFGSGVIQELLNILDGTENISKVITVATTNFKGKIDRALAARPGRFDRAIEIKYPKSAERRKVFELHAKSFGLTLDIEEALKTPAGQSLLRKAGVTHAHIKNVAETIAKRRRESSFSELELFKIAVKQQDTIISTDEKYSEREDLGFAPASPPKKEYEYPPDEEEKILSL